MDFDKWKAALVSEIEMIVVAVELNFDDGGVMVDDVVGIEIGSGALGENPSIIDFKGRVSLIHSHRGTLNEQIAVIELDLLYPTILHQRIFVDKGRLADLPPVNFIDAVFVGQRDYALVLQVIAVDAEADETIVSVAAGDGDSLGLEDVQADKAGVVV